MSLLQISEPNQSPKPHQHRHAIGIDLGTTHSLVARVVSGKSEVLTINTKDSDNANSDNANSDKLLPSVVYYGNQGNGGNQDNDGKQGNPIVGKAAYQYAQQDPANTIISAKRFMGRTLSDIKFNHPYVLHGDNDTMPSFVTKHGHISPVQVSADILKTLADTATKALPKDSLVGAVITVPAYFDNAQRRATQDAAQTAGLTVLRLLNEPTAAAIAYGLDKSLENKTVLVYDLGGGTFDVSVLALKDGVFEVLATGGNSALGGDDIDRLLANYLIKQSDFTPSQIDNEQKQRLNLLAKGYKEKLSQDSQDSIVAHFSLNQRHYQTPLNQQILAEIIKPVSDRTLLVSEQVLKDAQLSKDKLDAVILVGGSTRMPIIRQLVQDSFGKPPLCRINPDEVVAIGAAIFANQLINQHDDNVLLLDVTPLSLGLETMGGLVEVIIPRNTPIPIKKQQEFTTHSDGQTGMVIHVVQGERETVDNCRSLARFELFNIPPMKAGLARVQVVFAIDVNGQLTVSASEISTGVSASVHVVPSNGLSAEQQENLLKAGFIHAQADKALRMLIETKVEAERELLAIGSALAEFGDLLNHEQKTALITATDTLKHSLQSDDKAVIEKAVAVLKPVADHFASVIMNNSVKTALSGTHTDDW